MSALVVGKSNHIGPLSEVLSQNGFGSIFFQNSDSFGEYDLAGYGQLDMLVLIREAAEGLDVGVIFKEASKLNISMVLL